MLQRQSKELVYGFDRRQFLLASLVGLGGCTSIASRGQSPDDSEAVVNSENSAADIYIGDITGVWGLNDIKIEGIGLVTQLDGTGSDPGPSPQRTMLLKEMASHNVPKPNDLLAGKDTSLVLIRGYLPPAIQKGERFDVEVRTMPRSETTSLEGGFLLQARLRKMEILGGAVQIGHVTGLAKGRVIVDSVFDSSDPVLQQRGRIFGGAVAMTNRPIGLAVRGDANSVRTTTTIANRINQRFHTIENGGKAGAATPKDDRVIELAVPALYKNNITRFVSVISNLIYREAGDSITRIERLEKELLEPSLAARAALRLEAIGRESIASLSRAIRSDDVEVRFYAAEALAYLGDERAAKVLGEVARTEPAFRWRAITALSNMDDLDAGIALSDLMHTPSAETRYGAFRALHARSPLDPAIHEERLPKAEFAYHLIPTTAQPMIHFSKSRRPEIVVFGHDQRVNDNFLFVDKGLTVKSSDGSLKITRFSTGSGDKRIECSTTVDDLIRTLASLDLGYGDMLKVLRHAKETDAMNGRLVIDATPQPGRRYQRDDSESAASTHFVSGPVPELFRNTGPSDKDVQQASYEEEILEAPQSSETESSFMDKLKKVWRK